ncbi:MAG: histidine phosphatase family protein [Desulfobacterales bacterium]
MSIANRAAVLLASAAVLLWSPALRADEAAWEALRQGGRVVLLRHALAPGTGDPPGFRLGDCRTQRNLSAEGRDQARAIGEAFRRRGIPRDRVFSSRWCRCRETAALAFGDYQAHPALDSFFANPAREGEKTAALRQLLGEHPPGPGNLVLVTHQVNITAFTGVVPAPGEMVLVKLSPQGTIESLFRLDPVRP